MNLSFEISDPRYKERVMESFSRQGVMRTVNASIVDIGPGQVELEFPHHPSLTQQHGFIHAGIITTVVDSACGYAAFTLMPSNAAVLSIEFKINLLSPADGERFRAVGRVRKPGKTITVVEGDLFSVKKGKQKLAATMVGSMIAVYDREGVEG